MMIDSLRLLLIALVIIGVFGGELKQPERVYSKPDITKMLDIDKCPLGYYRIRTECQPCPAGSFCYEEERERCPKNQVQPQRGRPSCYECPEGTHADSLRLKCIPDALEPPKKCPPGEYVNSVNWICESCPIGHACPGDSVDPIRCDYANEYQDETGAAKCKYCLPGEVVSISRTFCIPPDRDINDGCIPGYYAEEQTMSCMPCRTGHYCPGNNQMYRCDEQEDSYQSEMKALHCDKCPPGTEPNKARTVCLNSDRLAQLERIARRMKAKEAEAIKGFEKRQGNTIRGTKKGSFSQSSNTNVEKNRPLKTEISPEEMELVAQLIAAGENPLERASGLIEGIQDLLTHANDITNNVVDTEPVIDIPTEEKLVITKMKVEPEEGDNEEEDEEVKSSSSANKEDL